MDWVTVSFNLAMTAIGGCLVKVMWDIRFQLGELCSTIKGHTDTLEDHEARLRTQERLNR